MPETELQQDDEISLFALGTTLLRNRRRIMRWMLIGAVLALLSVISKPALYRASASFVPQGNDVSRSGLAGLAGQFGVSLPSANQSLSPEFYSKLLKSRVVLLPIVRDTFVVPEMGGRRVSFLSLLEIKRNTPARREELGEKLLETMVTVSPVDRNTGVLEFAVATKWRSVSLAITTALLDGVNDYNQNTRRGQAKAERQFVEKRLALASDDLRVAEDRLERFLLANRNLENSPELRMEHERIQRGLALRQQVFTSLTQSYEDARIHEVRDTPVITIVEPPAVPTLPEPRGRAKIVLVGLLLGGFVGTLLSFMSGMLNRNQKHGNAEVDEFISALDEVKSEMLGRFRWFSGRKGR